MKLAAAELVAFDLLQPVLRSRGGINQAACELRKSQDFDEWARNLLARPSGEVRFRSISELSAVVRSPRGTRRRIGVQASGKTVPR